MELMWLASLVIPILADANMSKRYYWIADDIGEKMHLVDLNQSLNESDFSFNTLEIKFHLFTRCNVFSKEILIPGNVPHLHNSSFKGNRSTKVMIHGWKSNIESNFFKLLVKAFLTQGDYNVIGVDWSNGASGLYITSMANVALAGIAIASFVDWLIIETGLKNDQIHLLGHSLGAHVAGVAGRRMVQGTAAYLTALDPAQPGWFLNNQRVSHTDADYVEVIHTETEFCGLREPLGDTDFYPNRGKDMPGCRTDIACSHLRSYEYMAESINNDKFLGSRCDTFEDIVKGVCRNKMTLRMGGIKPKPRRKGLYILKTSSAKPYVVL